MHPGSVMLTDDARSNDLRSSGHNFALIHVYWGANWEIAGPPYVTLKVQPPRELVSKESDLPT